MLVDFLRLRAGSRRSFPAAAPKPCRPPRPSAAPRRHWPCGAWNTRIRPSAHRPRRSDRRHRRAAAALRTARRQTRRSRRGCPATSTTDLRAHRADSLRRFQIMRARQQRSRQQPLGLLLVGRDDGRTALRCLPAARRRRRAAEFSPSSSAPSRSACRRSSTGAPGGRLPQSISHCAPSSVSRTVFSTRATSVLCSVGPLLVQVDRETVLIGDGEVGADVVLDRHDGEIDAAGRSSSSSRLPESPPEVEHRERLAAEGMDDRTTH